MTKINNNFDQHNSLRKVLSKFSTGVTVVTSIDKKQRKINLSIKAKEIEEEKKAMAEYGSSDSGASLGDILGAALAKKDESSSK